MKLCLLKAPRKPFLLVQKNNPHVNLLKRPVAGTLFLSDGPSAMTSRTQKCGIGLTYIVFPYGRIIMGLSCNLSVKSPMEDRCMIEFLDLTKTYGKSGTMAVDHLNLKVESGELFGFIGPNGAGKTTTIKMLTGILTPTSGEAVIEGISMQREPMKAKRMIGFVPDGADLFDRLTGFEYLNFIADIFEVSAADRKARMEKYLELFELTGDAGNQIRSYSKGMRQKLATIGALIHDPQIWVLDEPMMGLDPRAAFLLKEEMRKQCEAGKTVFFSTHVLEVAEKLCTRIAVINKGKLAAVGTLEALQGQEHAESLEDIFLELTQKSGDGESE